MDKKLILWDVEASSKILSMSGHADRIYSCQFMPVRRRRALSLSLSLSRAVAASMQRVTPALLRCCDAGRDARRVGVSRQDCENMGRWRRGRSACVGACEASAAVDDEVGKPVSSPSHCRRASSSQAVRARWRVLCWKQLQGRPQALPRPVPNEDHGHVSVGDPHEGVVDAGVAPRGPAGHGGRADEAGGAAGATGPGRRSRRRCPQHRRVVGRQARCIRCAAV